MSDRFYRFMVNLGGSHPWPVERARALDEWAVSSEYANILAGNYPRNGQMVRTKLCPNPNCRLPVEPDSRFCNNCGTPFNPH